MQPETTTRPAIQLDTEKQKFLVSFLNGTALYVLAYYLVWGLHQGAEVIVSRFFDLRSIWDPSRINYALADDEWWRMAAIVVHGAGPVVCLITGAAAFLWFWKYERAQRGLTKLLMLWVAFHSCNAILGALLADTFMQSGISYVVDWLFQLGRIANVLLAVVAGLVQVGLGYYAAIAFLQAHDSKTVMRYANRQQMVLSTAVLPWLVGGTLIALAKEPYTSVHELLHLITMGLLIIPMALGCLNEMFSSTVRRPLVTRVVWGWLALAVVAALMWRLALSPPVVFG